MDKYDKMRSYRNVWAQVLLTLKRESDPSGKEKVASKADSPTPLFYHKRKK